VVKKKSIRVKLGREYRLRGGGIAHTFERIKLYRSKSLFIGVITKEKHLRVPIRHSWWEDGLALGFMDSPFDIVEEIRDLRVKKKRK